MDCRHHITATRIGGRFCQLRADSTTLPAFLLNESTWVVRAQSEQNRRRSDLTLGIQQKFKLGRRDARVAGSLAVIGPSLRARACAREIIEEFRLRFHSPWVRGPGRTKRKPRALVASRIAWLTVVADTVTIGTCLDRIPGVCRAGWSPARFSCLPPPEPAMRRHALYAAPTDPEAKFFDDFSSC